MCLRCDAAIQDFFDEILEKEDMIAIIAECEESL